MTVCENPATHQVTETKLPVCGEHASREKRGGALVALSPGESCQYVEPDADPEPEGAENLEGTGLVQPEPEGAE